MKKNFWLGAVEIGAGVLLASPADEAGAAILSGGVTAPAAIAQLPVTAAVGALLIFDGLRRI